MRTEKPVVGLLRSIYLLSDFNQELFTKKRTKHSTKKHKISSQEQHNRPTENSKKNTLTPSSHDTMQ